MKEKYSLPYDYTRCPRGNLDVCEKCLRTEAGNPIRQSYFVKPPIEDGKCKYVVLEEMLKK